MLRGGPEDNSTGNARRDGVLSKVKPSGIQVVMAPEFGKWTEDGGIRVMEDMLAKHKQLNAVFCENDSIVSGRAESHRRRRSHQGDLGVRLRRPEGGDRADRQGH